MLNPGKILTLLTFGTLLLLLGNCNSDKYCHKHGTCPQDYRRFPLGEAKAYLYTLPGSYWIYKNTSTGDLDTQTCTAFICDTVIRSGTRNDTKHITVEYERIRRTINSSFNEWEYYDVTGFYNPDAIRPLNTNLDRDAYGEGHNAPFFHPFDINYKDGTSTSITSFIRVDSVLTIQNKQYYNVASFDLNPDDIWESGLTKTGSIYYWAKDVGIVKRYGKLYNTSWELIDYKILR